MTDESPERSPGFRPDAAAPASVGFCTDAELGYRRSLTDFSGPLALDESYRLAHLPLLAPAHPRVIPRREGKSYEMGRHPRIFSLVLPVDDAALQASAAFRKLERQHAKLQGRLSLFLYARDGNRIRARMFAPLAGTWEDPATGSASATLGALLLSLDGGEAASYTITQGVEMGRPSLLNVASRRAEDGYRSRVGGACAPMFRGEAEL